MEKNAAFILESVANCSTKESQTRQKDSLHNFIDFSFILMLLRYDTKNIVFINFCTLFRSNTIWTVIIVKNNDYST